MPLHPERHPLTLADQQQLNEFLHSPGMVIMKRVIEARANFAATEAIVSACQAKPGDAMLDNANAKLMEAGKMRDCLEVIAELQTVQDHFEVRILTSKPKQPTT